jgi:DNA polymerase III subunit gamma/tau
MAYKAFALQYRPKNFDEVIGQEHIVNALKNAITAKRVHHAYIFSGPRGVGKTSLARIFAKALNCEAGPTVTPCGKCNSCMEIARGASLDVIEIDGASNRGIDEIRELRESAKLSPAYSRFKIYIIDEVHMLTTEAFNALLKTLEEPPEHVKFLFATTHPQKVIPTILSRCQKFQFSLLPIEKIVKKLKNILTVENVKVEENLIFAVARAAAGSFRDAESLLDQIVPIISENGEVGDILAFLGIVDEETLNQAVKYFLEKNPAGAFDLIDKVVKDGKDLGVLLSGLIEALRDCLLAKLSAQAFAQAVELPPQSREFLSAAGKKYSTAELLKGVDLFITAKELAHRLGNVRIPLELAFVRFAQGNFIEAPVPAAEVPVQKSADRQVRVELRDEFSLELDNIDLEEKPLRKKDDDPVNTQAQEGFDDGILLSQIKPKWPMIIARVQKIRMAIASHLEVATLASSSGRTLCLGYGKKDVFHKESIESEKNRAFIERVLTEAAGKPVVLKIIIVDNLLPSSAKKNIPEKAAPASVDTLSADAASDSDSFVNDILDSFNGKIHTDN